MFGMKKEKQSMIESTVDFSLDKACTIIGMIITALVLCIPYVLCQLMSIKGKNKYFRLALGAFPIFMISVVLSSWLAISSPFSFAADSFGAAQGLMKLEKDVKRIVVDRLPDGSVKMYKDYGADHMVNMAGNATGLRQESPVDKAKGVVMAPVNWAKGLFGMVF